MSVVGIARVTCPECGTVHDCKLVQSINTRGDPESKQKLLDGDLNVLACDCGERMQLAATVVFHDPDVEFLCQVCPGDEAAMVKAAELMTAIGATGTRRLLPSLNALVEKVKLLDAKLEDWAIEMTKVLLLATLGTPSFDRVLLFQLVDRDAQMIRWLLFDEHGREPEWVSSPLAAYERLASRTHARAAGGELRVDRAWAVDAVRDMIANAN